MVFCTRTRSLGAPQKSARKRAFSFQHSQMDHRGEILDGHRVWLKMRNLYSKRSNKDKPQLALIRVLYMCNKTLVSFRKNSSTRIKHSDFYRLCVKSSLESLLMVYLFRNKIGSNILTEIFKLI